MTTTTRQDRNDAIVASAVARLNGRRGAHVSIRTVHGRRYQGELRALTVRMYGEAVIELWGPRAPKDDIAVGDIVTMRTTARRHCAWCREGW